MGVPRFEIAEKKPGVVQVPQIPQILTRFVAQDGLTLADETLKYAACRKNHFFLGRIAQLVRARR